MNSTKNSSAEPRSRSNTTTISDTPTASRIGAKCLGSGVLMRPIRKVATPSSSRRSVRYPAKKTARQILANSPGWKLTGPIETQMREPLISCPMPGTSGRTSSIRPSRPKV